MKKIGLALAAVFLMMISFMTTVSAEAAGAGFTIDAVQPENQIGDASYFNLKVTPDQSQELTLKVKNLENQAIKIKISPNPAFTNNNGQIDYSDQTVKRDDTAKYDVTQLVSSPQEVDLAANETKDVKFTLTAPKEAFSGTIMGGFYAEKLSDDTADSSSSEGQMLTVKNKYSLVLGLALTENPDQNITPKLKLNDVKAGLSDEHTAVLANLQNIEPQAFGSMTVDAKIYKKGDDNVFKETKKDNQEMAPNSNYDFAIDWEKEPLEAGDYHLALVATSGTQEWKFERDFTIAQLEAQTINEKSVDTPEQSNNLWLYVIIGVLVLIILLLLVFLLGRKKGRQAKDEA
ncbi:MAG: DUF916 and DUF3324 domain-containing protein [Enterococcus sp.]